MKLNTLLSILMLGLVFISCSDDDDSGSVQNTNNYFPLVVGNTWEYDNQVTATGQADFSGSETLSVSGPAQAGGVQGFDLESSNPANSGLSTIIFTQGMLYKDNFNLMYTGEFGLGVEEFSSIVFDLENVPVYNANLNPSAEMFTEEATFNEQFDGIPMTLNFKITTTMGQSFETFNVNGVDYEDVISSKWVIDLEVIAGVEPITTTLLEDQKVSDVTNYFAKDVGLIYSETLTTLDFEDIQILPLEDIDSTTQQELTAHDVALD